MACGASPATTAENGSPRLPHATADRPPARSTSAMRVTAVLLPLVPVTATMAARQNRKANSISLITGMPRRGGRAPGGGGVEGGGRGGSAARAGAPAEPPRLAPLGPQLPGRILQRRGVAGLRHAD